MAENNSSAPLKTAGVSLAEHRANRIYVAGPMTGLPDLNFPAFNAAADELRAGGWHVENPAEHGILDGAQWSDYMHTDLQQLSTCSAIYLLSGWSKSRGATLEAHVAQALGMAVYYAPNAETQAVAAQAAPLDDRAQKLIGETVRCSYDTGYNDARRALSVRDDGYPGYDGRAFSDTQIRFLLKRLDQDQGAAQAAPAAVAGLDHTAMHDALLWLRSALDCKDWHWSPEQRDCAELAYHASIAALPATEPARAAVAVTEAQIDAILDEPGGMIFYVSDQRQKQHLFARRVLALATPALPATEDSSAGDLAEASHQTKLLAQALGDCILASGIVRSDLEMSGQQLLMFAEDLKELLLARQAEVQADPVAKARVSQDADGKKTVELELRYGDLPSGTHLLFTAPQAQPPDALDAARLMFLMDETDGFVIVEKDKYDFAIECAGEAGREEPTAADELNGVRRLLDAAMAAAQEGRKA